MGVSLMLPYMTENEIMRENFTCPRCHENETCEKCGLSLDFFKGEYEKCVCGERKYFRSDIGFKLDSITSRDRRRIYLICCVLKEYERRAEKYDCCFRDIRINLKWLEERLKKKGIDKKIAKTLIEWCGIDLDDIHNSNLYSIMNDIEYIELNYHRSDCCYYQHLQNLDER